jgi:hypothetical protein
MPDEREPRPEEASVSEETAAEPTPRAGRPPEVPKRAPLDRPPFSPMMLIASALAVLVLVAVAGRWALDRFVPDPEVDEPPATVQAVERAPFSRVDEQPEVAAGSMAGEEGLPASPPAGSVQGADAAAADAGPADSPHMGTLELVTVPPGAQVSFDGRPVGETPLTLRELAGMARLSVTKDGYQSHHRTITLEAGHRTDIGPITLEPLPDLHGPVELYGVGLGGGFVSIDGGARIELPARVELSSGVHNLQVFAPDGEVYTLARSVVFDAEGSVVKLDLQEL